MSMAGKAHHMSPVGSPSSDTDMSPSKDLDRFLPIANVSRIMKKSLPSNAKISKEAKETVQECVSEFISFVTGEASDKCQREKRKTINGDDLLWAMTTLGFENYVGTLREYLGKYREVEMGKNTMARQGGQSSIEDISTNHGVNKVSTPTANSPGITNGFYKLGASVSLRNVGDGGRVVGYGENSKKGDFCMEKIHEHGDGNISNRVLTANHHGIGW
ncbi:hypothetical protein GIB67_022663 [Kingdonia uniflora]|uniref:Transcription factor CBF/NF-Y/archaeal histone domain-containing protein n=1 Tax=Kingdonia uniflora TaxID=39325 RepID=A0A7J7P873_9MAGN|nr:hypothetical protein GIB67_022663 [Kingdonia uniflora]